MCNCNGSGGSSSLTLLQGATGATGATGAAGTNGTDGIYGGYSSTWLFSTSTSNGPTSTLLRLNHATYSSVTAIYVADENSEAIDLNDFLDSLRNGGDFGYIRIFKEDDADIFWYGIITAVTDNTTDFTLTVTYVLHNGSFAANDKLVLTFSPNGADGAAGTNGNDGGVILYNDFSNSRTGIKSVANGGAGTSGALETVNTYTAVIPGGTMASDKDEIIITGLITNNEPSNNDKWFLSVDGTNNILTGNTDGYAFANEFSGGVMFTMSITRLSSSQAWATMEFWYVGAASSSGSGLADVSQGSTISFFAESPLLSVAWQTDKDIIIKVDTDGASATQEIKSILNVKYFHKI